MIEKSCQLSKVSDNLSGCQRERYSSGKTLDDKLSDLSNIRSILADCQEKNTSLYKESNVSFHILIGLVTVELLVIIIFLWNCVTRKGNVEQIKPNNVVGESQAAVESHPNEHNLIYATLDLKPTKKASIKTDEVIYSTVERVSRPNESAPVVPRSYKKH